MITTSWNISDLEREPSDNYVFIAHWTVLATDGVFSSSSYGFVKLERPETKLIPFEKLTEELVISWVKEKLGEEQVSSILNSLSTQIEEQKNPPKLSGVPWSNSQQIS